MPKTTKTFSFYAPNWGDSSNGTHLVSRTREVYQREFIPPKGVELSVTLIEQQADTWIVKFAIDQVINRSAPDFEGELLYNLNILQENVAAADVFESVATFADYAATIRVDCVPPTVSAQIGAALAYRDGNDVLRHDETDIRVGNATSRCATGQGVQQDGEIR